METATVHNKVLSLLAWSEGTWGEYFMDTADDYLANNCQVDEQTKQLLMTYKPGRFWAWFRNLWNIRDESFVAETEYLGLSATELRKIYKNVHDVHNIRLFPSKPIFESYKEVLCPKV